MEFPKEKKKDLEKILYKLEQMPRSDEAKGLLDKTIQVVNLLQQKYYIDKFYVHRLERIEDRYRK